jgi:protein gp37
MADKTTIEWTDATWNPVRGCTRVSEGCRNCYAEVMAARFSDPGQWGHGLAQRVTLPGGGIDHRWTGRVELVPAMLDAPLRWRKPRRIFVNSTSDLFHGSLPDDAIDQVFAVMALAPHHTFQVLTKRPERARAYLSDPARRRSAATFAALRHATGAYTIREDCSLLWPLPNVWLGTSVEDQATADTRIPHLLATPAAVRFISAEPLLGPVDLTRLDPKIFAATANALTGRWRWEDGPSRQEAPALDWVICGGESGPGARPMHPDWARSLRDQCQAAGVAFFFKQWGEWAVVYDRDHVDPDFQRCGDMTREHPKGRWLNLAGGHGFHGDRVCYVAPIGKRAAGRSLDGRTHDAFPVTA